MVCVSMHGDRPKKHIKKVGEVVPVISVAEP